MSRKRKPAHPLIGQKVQFVPAHLGAVKGETPTVRTGTIVWVHPKERFMLVQYGCPATAWSKGGTIRECIPCIKS